MDKYTVHEYQCIGAFSYSRVVYGMLKDTFGIKNRRTGCIIVFQDEVTDVEFLTNFGECHLEHLLCGTHVEKDGSGFSKQSICMDIREYSCDDAATLAQECLCLSGCSTVMLKDFVNSRLMVIHNNENCTT